MNRWLTLGILLTLAGSVAAANLPVRRFALFVGANQGGAAQQPLLYAQKDALKMQQVMQEVGGVSAADRILLLDPSPEDVRSALVALGQRMGGDAESRRTEFLFYYSGHSDDQGLLLGEQSLGYKALRDGLQGVPADVRIAILDSCSSGAFARLKGGVQRAPFLGQDSSQMTGHAFLTSSSENEASQESDTLQGSFFTHYLVSALRGGADRAGDGLITLNEAYEYAFQNTLARTESTRAGPQHPSYEIQLSGTGNLILADIKTSTARLDVASDVAGKLYVRGLSGQLFAEVTKDAGAGLSLAVPAGTYTVTVVTAQKSLSGRVVLPAKGTTTVSSKDFQEQDLARFAVRGPAPAEPEPVATDVPVDLVPFSLGLIPGLPGSGWGASNQKLALAAFVGFAQTVQGLQASGVISLNGESVTGVQGSGVGSISRGRVTGVQSAGVFSIASEGFQGLQSSGVFNIAGGDSNGVWQGAGVFNISRGTYRGIQSAGVFNIADTVEGVQMAGVFNVAGDVQGVQVGVVNINKHIDGAGFGLVFISPDAYYHPTVLWDDQGKTHAVFQWGMGWMYWLAGVVADGKDVSTKPWSQLSGAGVKVNGRFLFWDTDAGWQTDYVAQRWVAGKPYVRSTVGVQGGWVALEAGVLVNPSWDASANGGWSLGPLSFSGQKSWYAGLRFF